jgi:hypothetical protein
MVFVLIALVLAVFIHILAFVVLFVWLLKRRWQHLLIATMTGVIGGAVGFLFPSSGTSFYVIKGNLVDFFLELSLDGAKSVVGAALGLFLGISFIILSSKRKIHA